MAHRSFVQPPTYLTHTREPIASPSPLASPSFFNASLSSTAQGSRTATPQVSPEERKDMYQWRGNDFAWKMSRDEVQTSCPRPTIDKRCMQSCIPAMGMTSHTRKDYEYGIFVRRCLAISSLHFYPCYVTVCSFSYICGTGASH